jgi:hypothetical protein
MMQAEKPEETREQEEALVEDGAGRDSQDVASSKVLLSYHDSDDDEMMKAYKACLDEQKEKQKVPRRRRSNNGYGFEYSPSPVLHEHESFQFSNLSQVTMNPSQRGMIPPPVAFAPHDTLGIVPLQQHPSWNALDMHHQHMAHRMQQKQQGQQHLSQQQEQNFAMNVRRQLQKHQQEAALPPARPPKKDDATTACPAVVPTENGNDDDEEEDNDDDEDPVETKKKQKKKRKVNGGGDMKYREDELDYLMQVCEDILPMGKYEWERVTTRYNSKYPRRQRKMVNLRNQFNTFAKAKPPTGDPDCPPLVRRAKRVVRRTTEKAGMEVLNDPEQLAKCDIPSVNGSTQDAEAIAATLSTDPKRVVSSRKKKNSADKQESILKVLLASEKLQAKREERRERRRQEERNETFRMAMMALTSLASAITGRDIPVVTAPVAARKRESSTADSDSSGSSLSDSDSKDSPPTRRLKFNRRLKKYKKKASEKSGGNNKKDDDEESATSELGSRVL